MFGIPKDVAMPLDLTEASGSKSPISLETDPKVEGKIELYIAFLDPNTDEYNEILKKLEENKE